MSVIRLGCPMLQSLSRESLGETPSPSTNPRNKLTYDQHDATFPALTLRACTDTTYQLRYRGEADEYTVK